MKDNKPSLTGWFFCKEISEKHACNKGVTIKNMSDHSMLKIGKKIFEYRSPPINK